MLNQFHGLGDAAGFHGVLHLEAGEDFLAVAADGVDTDIKSVGNLGTFQTGINQRQAVRAGPRQHCWPRR